MAVNSHNSYKSTQGGPDTETQATNHTLSFSSEHAHWPAINILTQGGHFRKHLRAGDWGAGALLAAQSRLLGLVGLGPEATAQGQAWEGSGHRFGISSLQSFPWLALQEALE